MQRLFLAAALLAVSCQSARPADDKKDERKESYAELRTEFFKAFNNAKDAAGKKKVIAEYAPKFQKLAEAEPKKADALNFLFQMADAGQDVGIAQTATGLFKKNNLKDASAKPFLRYFAARPSEGSVALLRLVMDENPDKMMQARAAKSLVAANEALGKLADRLKEDKEFKSMIAEQRGDSYVKFVEANSSKFAASAKEYKQMLNKGKFKGIYPDLSIGKKFPQAISKDLDGKEARLSDHKGKVVVLDIWATWCPPCRAMIPHEREMVEKLKNKPFALVSISADDTPRKVKAFLKQKDNEMPWTHWHEGPASDLLEAWDVEHFPTIYVLDSKGVIRYKEIRGKELEKAVKKLVKEAEDAKKSS